MGRPWLNAEDFNVSMQKVTDTLDEQIKNEMFSKTDIIDYNKAFFL